MPHSSIRQLLLDLSKALQEAGVDHALIGGLALAPRGYPRGTRDVDFLIHESAIERVRALMHERGAKTVLEDDDFSYVDDGIRADFQHARRAISQDMLARAEAVPFAGVEIPVLQAEDLIGLKVQAYHNNPARLQDQLDIQRLIAANWGRLDLERIRSYFRLFDHEKDFDRALDLAAPKD
jgi:predicted nucleotidyltransferase